MKDHRSVTIELEGDGIARPLLGVHDENIKLVERTLDVRIAARGERLSIEGAGTDVETAERLLAGMVSILRKGSIVSPADIGHALNILRADPSANLEKVFLDVVLISARKSPITPKSLNQKRYVDAIRGHDIVFGIGPAGTGKTYLAMAMAVSALTAKEVRRIILTRPAVEAGEKLGFLPGNLYEKVNPYLRPLYDALHDMMALDRAIQLVETGVIEVAPLAFMRGRTLNDSFVILDEAQNTTADQMKMFLTRLGVNSRTVVTGDITQIDLPDGRGSGLIQVKEILKGIEGIDFVYFNKNDVVRHRLVMDIIAAYAKNDEAGGGK